VTFGRDLRKLPHGPRSPRSTRGRTRSSGW
jgi:hypothetical protein